MGRSTPPPRAIGLPSGPIRRACARSLSTATSGSGCPSRHGWRCSSWTTAARRTCASRPTGSRSTATRPCTTQTRSPRAGPGRADCGQPSALVGGQLRPQLQLARRASARAGHDGAGSRLHVPGRVAHTTAGQRPAGGDLRRAPLRPQPVPGLVLADCGRGVRLAGLRCATVLDRRLARALALLAIVAVAVAGTGEELHGRPGVSGPQYVLLAVVLAFVAWGLARLVRRREGWFGYFVVALAAIWEGASLSAFSPRVLSSSPCRGRWPESRSWPVWPPEPRCSRSSSASPKGPNGAGSAPRAGSHELG